MASHTDIANRWSDVHAGTASRYLGTGRRANVFVDRDKLYSYGTHFELARFVRPTRGAPFYLLNGDTYSVTTSRHQSDVRSAVARHADKFPSLIVPHSAMDSAGIDPDSIVPVAIDPERTETTTHRVSVPGLVKLAEDAASGTFGWNRSASSDAAVAAGHYSQSARGEMSHEGDTYSVSVTTRGWNHSAPSVRPCGACEGTGSISGAPCGNPQCEAGTVTTPYGGAFEDYNPPRVSYYGRGGNVALRHVEGDTFELDTWRHFLGAAVFAATVTDYSYRPCRKHADNGRGFCDTCGFNVDNAPVELRAGESVRHSSRAPMIERKRTRRAYFVSAFDSNESHPHYFLAELPATLETGTGDKVPNRPTTVADALESLAPWSVRVAIASGAEVQRQGDVFAIPNGAAPAAYPIPFRHSERNARIPFDGATGRHIVSELVTLTSADGRAVRYFGRGRIVHDSDRGNGRREHATVKLGATWFELVRNRVPMSAPNVSTGRGRFGRNAPGIAVPRAWSIIGRID